MRFEFTSVGTDQSTLDEAGIWFGFGHLWERSSDTEYLYPEEDGILMDNLREYALLWLIRCSIDCVFSVEISSDDWHDVVLTYFITIPDQDHAELFQDKFAKMLL